MFKDIAPKPAAKTVRNARQLRRSMTLPEALLWREPRGKPLGLKFRRQHPCGRFVLDFYCGDARLAIEVDGAAHDFESRAQRDLAGDAQLKAAGIYTLRIAASEVLRSPGQAAEAIVRTAMARLPLPHPALPDGPPPRDKLGEDL